MESVNKAIIAIYESLNGLEKSPIPDLLKCILVGIENASMSDDFNAKEMIKIFEIGKKNLMMLLKDSTSLAKESLDRCDQLSDLLKLTGKQKGEIVTAIIEKLISAIERIEQAVTASNSLLKSLKEPANLRNMTGGPGHLAARLDGKCKEHDKIVDGIKPVKSELSTKLENLNGHDNCIILTDDAAKTTEEWIGKLRKKIEDKMDCVNWGQLNSSAIGQLNSMKNEQMKETENDEGWSISTISDYLPSMPFSGKGKEKEKKDRKGKVGKNGSYNHPHRDQHCDPYCQKHCQPHNHPY